MHRLVWVGWTDFFWGGVNFLKILKYYVQGIFDQVHKLKNNMPNNNQFSVFAQK